MAAAVALTSVAAAAAVISVEEGDRSAEVGPLAEAGHSAEDVHSAEEDVHSAVGDR